MLYSIVMSCHIHHIFIHILHEWCWVIMSLESSTNSWKHALQPTFPGESWGLLWLVGTCNHCLNSADSNSRHIHIDPFLERFRLLFTPSARMAYFQLAVQSHPLIRLSFWLKDSGSEIPVKDLWCNGWCSKHCRQHWWRQTCAHVLL